MRTLELMGLVTVNIMVALTLSATVLSQHGNKGIESLTSDNVGAFINDFATTSTSLRNGPDRHKLVEYMMAHLSEEGRYKTRVSYRVADGTDQETQMDMGRMEFIGHTLQGLKSMEKHETRTNIEHIKIAEGGKEARVIVTSYERGVMPVENPFGDVAKMPVLGMSHCAQDIVLSPDKTIQIRGAECVTTINFEEAF